MQFFITSLPKENDIAANSWNVSQSCNMHTSFYFLTKVAIQCDSKFLRKIECSTAFKRKPALSNAAFIRQKCNSMKRNTDSFLLANTQRLIGGNVWCKTPFSAVKTFATDFHLLIKFVFMLQDNLIFTFSSGWLVTSL